MALEPISAVVGVAEKLIDRFFPDPTKKMEALAELRRMEQSGDLTVIANQIEVNKIEAASPNWFVSGWRPAVGWVCVLALAVQMVFAPIAVWAAMLFGHVIPMVIMDVSLLTTLLIGMLGLGGMRTVEKLQGVSSK